MQRVLSVEASRRGGGGCDAVAGSEYVTKRFCCSIILTVTFFGFLGGFLMGRFMSERATLQLQADFQEISRKIGTLNNNLQDTFPNDFNHSSAPCSQYIFLKCNFSQIGKNDTGQLLATEYLRTLNACFGNG